MFHLCYADAIRKTIPRKRGGELLKGVISMVRLIMGEKGTGKTKKLIEMINTTAQEDNGSVVCVEAKSTMTFDLHYHVRLISAYE